MQAFKPLMPLRGKTLIENTIDSIFSSGAQKVVVVTGYRAEELEQLLCEKYADRVIIARNAEYDRTDMLCSVRIGCEKLPACDAFFLLPGDMPVVQESTFRTIMAQRTSDASVIFPTLDGYRKHPPLVDRRLVPEILNYQGEGGLRGLWSQLDSIVRTVAVDDVGVWTDLDTREDYARCKERYEKKR